MSLTRFLQTEFQRQCPPGWVVGIEAPLLTPELARLIGYAPRADVLLENPALARRYWIEFEISRADPVANHAKFATAHLFQPYPAQQVFISMMSSHVARGRHNLAANTIFLMRRMGIQAFQTVLLPQHAPAEIKRLNYLSVDELAHENLNSEAELVRVLTVTVVAHAAQGHQILYATNYADVILNVYRWNQEIQFAAQQQQWGKRTVTYFVYDPQSEEFAPSKFCAFLPADPEQIGMNIALYSQLGEGESRFDGKVARDYLTKTLGMVEYSPDQVPPIQARFVVWHERHQAHIRLHPNGQRFIVPPAWYG
jgi:hypothetical protein